MTTLRQQSVSGFKWNAIESIAVRGIQFFIGLVLARVLSPSDFGVVGLLTIFIVLSQAFIDGGFSNALVRKQNKTNIDYSTAFYFNIGVGIICYAVLYIISPGVAKIFDMPLLNPLLKVLGFSVFLNSLSLVHIAKLTFDINFKWQAIATLIAVLVSGVAGIVIAYRGYGVWALVWQTVIMAAIKSFVLIVYCKWRPNWVFSKKSFNYLFSYGSKLVISNLLFAVYSQVSTILIGKFYSTVDLGYYTRGRQFANLPCDIITGVLGKVTFPILSRIQDNENELVRVYRKYIRLTSLVCVFSLLLLAAIAKPLIITVLTEKWVGCIIYLQLFCFSMLIDHISRLNLNLLQVKGRSDLYLKLEVIKRIVSIVMMLVALPFGIIYLCLSLIVYAVFAFFVNTYYTGKLFNLSCWIQLQDLSKYFFVSILVCFPTYALTFIGSLNDLLTIVVGCILSTFLYWILLRKDEQMVELINMAKRMIHIN